VTNASFVGWGPIENPQFMVYVWLEKPQTSEWASQVAAPVFERVAKRLVVLMNIPPDNVREVLAGQ
jgi:cell division protein FtsI/penicillin-binding protein 2